MTDLDKLKLMTAWETEPVLTVAELDGLLASAAKTDATGLGPTDPGWTPSYDLDSAAAEGWLIKAGRASAAIEADPANPGSYTSQVFDNCTRMARVYASRTCSTMRFPSSAAL